MAEPTEEQPFAAALRRWNRPMLLWVTLLLTVVPRPADGLGPKQASSQGIRLDCTSQYRGSRCPDLRALLAFKAANLDPFDLLSSWRIPCNITLASKAEGFPESAGFTLPGTQAPAQMAAAVVDSSVLDATAEGKAQGTGTGSGKALSEDCRTLARVVCRRWFGVKCNTQGRVKELNLNTKNSAQAAMMSFFGTRRTLWGDFSLGQSLPPEIEGLEQLTLLDLSYNLDSSSNLGGLVGPIPRELSRLTRLEVLNLGNNQLWGPVPSFLSALTRLTSLSLNLNNFTGSLPPSLSALQRLKFLQLSGLRGISGSAPSALGRLASLEYVSLTSSPLQGSIPDSFSALTNLTYWDMAAVGFSGSLPSWISRLSGLGYLGTQRNNFSGSIPPELGRLSGLFSIDLSYNKLSGSIPETLIDGLCNASRSKPETNLLLAELNYLTLSNNSLSGDLPMALSRCTALQILQLSRNRFTGEFPPLEFFTSMPSLQELYLAYNKIRGTVPIDLFSKSEYLTSAVLSNNRLEGPMPLLACNKGGPGPLIDMSNNNFTGRLEDVLGSPGLAKCLVNDATRGRISKQWELHLAGNSLTGPIPPEAFTMTITALHLENNRLSGPLPQRFNCSKVLLDFSAAQNELSGTIPAALGTCTGLQNLDLSGNRLKGGIPKDLRRTGRNLQTLMLGGNLLEGSIPAVLDALQQLSALNLSANRLSSTLPSSITQLPLLALLDMSNNNLTGPLLPQIGGLSLLTALSFKGNQLSGSVPISLAPPNMPLLRLLDLSSNKLSGAIPYGFASVSPQHLALNLSYNNLSGPIPGAPTSEFARTMPSSSVANNSLCGGFDYPPCPVPTTAGSSLSTGAIVGIAVAGVFGLLLAVLGTLWFVRKRSEWAGGTMIVFEHLDFRLTIQSILDATENFSDKSKLGRGGFGSVYKAVLEDGREVAIKRLSSQSMQGDKEFEAEVQILGSIRHRNLAVLVAAFIGPAPSRERLLIYNFLPGGSLEEILTSTLPEDSPYRFWEQRHSIALDIARGLKYLHHDANPRVVHRDMKPANILMDDKCAAYVADFGLAREVDTQRTHMSTQHVLGTIGYMAPEYIQRGKLTFKSDVYAYGVILLQLISGKSPVDDEISERGLARWVAANESEHVVDPSMEFAPTTSPDGTGETSGMTEILGAIKLGLVCTSRVPADRPSMAEVVHLLENLEDFARGMCEAETSLTRRGSVMSGNTSLDKSASYKSAANFKLG